MEYCTIVNNGVNEQISSLGYSLDKVTCFYPLRPYHVLVIIDYNQYVYELLLTAV